MTINKILEEYSIDDVTISKNDILEMHRQLKNLVSEADRIAVRTNDYQLKNAVAEGYIFLELLNRKVETKRKNKQNY